MSKFFNWVGANILQIMFSVWALFGITLLISSMENESSRRQQVISEHPQCILLDKSIRDNYYYMVCDGNVVIVKPNS